MRAFNKIVALKCTPFPYKCCDCNACLFCNAASETPIVFLQALQGSQRLDVIVQKEQQVAGVVTKADADKVIAASVNRIAPAAAAQIDLTAAPAQAASKLAQLSPSIEELQKHAGCVCIQPQRASRAGKHRGSICAAAAGAILLADAAITLSASVEESADYEHFQLVA